jgi:hypothetical protein
VAGPRSRAARTRRGRDTGTVRGDSPGTASRDRRVSAASPQRRSRRPIIVVGAEPVDWRRVMWYLPEATAVQVFGDMVDFVGRHTEISQIPEKGFIISSKRLARSSGSPQTQGQVA